MAHAEAIITGAVAHFGLKLTDDGTLPKMLRGDWTAVGIAWRICRNTTLLQRWIAERLQLKSAGNVSERVRRFENLKPSEMRKELRDWKKIVF